MGKPSSSADGITTTVDNGILSVVLDAPERRNALRDDAVELFSEAVAWANTEEDVRVILVEGANGHFCAGADIVARNADPAARPRVSSISRRLPNHAHRLIPLLVGSQVPVVAAVQGYAVGLGLQLVLAADFAVVASDATLFEPFAARGMGPDSGATWLLPRAVGAVRAREMLLLGRRLTGDEAAEWNLAHRVVPGEQVAETARELAGRLAAGPTVALGLTRKLINEGWERPLVGQLTAEAFGMEVTARSKDFREGLTAFRERRAPRFLGR